MSKRIPLIVLLVVITISGNNVLAFDLSRNDATQAPSCNGKAAYSLLLKEDVAAFEQSPVGAPTAAGQAQPEEKGATESLFSLDFPNLLLRDTWYVLSSPVRWDAHDWLTVAVGIRAVLRRLPSSTNPYRHRRSATRTTPRITWRTDIPCSGEPAPSWRWDSFMWEARFSTTKRRKRSPLTAPQRHSSRPALLPRH